MLGAETTEKRVLVVDGHEGRRNARGRRFADADYEVIYAQHALDAFRLARRWLPDIVLLHAEFRDAAVTELARRLAIDPRTKRATLIMTSECGVVGVLRLHMQVAMKDVVLVPCTDDFVRRLVSGAEGTP
jgi:PleD family two-component response regulator